MDPNRACQMIQTLADGLAQLDPDQAALYASNAQLAVDQIQQAYPVMQAALADLPCRELITFHDGFSYFADAFDLTILRAIEEEAGSEASAREVADIVAEIQTHQLPPSSPRSTGPTPPPRSSTGSAGARLRPHPDDERRDCP